jgi:hypothetical protein
MSGRYGFSMPEPRQREGWFRIGSIDMTTTACVVAAGLLSMLLYAIDPATAFKLAYESGLVRDGEFWRMVTWPLLNPPDIWLLIGLAFFWWIGHAVEEDLGRKAMAVLLVCMAVIPTAIVTLLNIRNETGNGQWSAFSYGATFLSLGVFTIFAAEHPTLRLVFNIPAWVFAAAYVFIAVLQYTGARAWAELILVLLVIVVGCVGARQRGMLDNLDFIPRWHRLAGPPRSPYGEVRSAQPKSKRGRGSRRSKGTSAPGSVVTGPWEQPTGPTPLEQAELDVLLDKISATGIDSLTTHEKDRLNALSRKMRGS